MKPTDRIAALLGAVREKNPLIHNITNYVTVNDCANIQLAIGGSPIMSDELEDIKDITQICGALVINIGTLNERTVRSMHESCKIASENGIPVVLDPVGCGASAFRNKTTEALLGSHKFAVVRGNLSELSFIAGFSSSTRGVDSSSADDKNDSVSVAKTVAKKYGCIAALTGKVDVITDGVRVIKIENGNAMMGKVTGTGCMATALVGVFLGLKGNAFDEAAAAIAVMGIAGDMALERAEKSGTASFKEALIDAVSTMNGAEILRRAKIYES